MIMFNPEDFLKVSENIFELISDKDACESRMLNNECEEALYRTEVSRAYYAVYLSCRDLLKKLGEDIERS